MSSQKGEEVAADNIYTAERLVKKRMRRGRAEYLVKWQGYSEKNNTWEPESNILDRNLIDDYERRNAPPTDADSAKPPSSALQFPCAEPLVMEAPKSKHSEAGRRKRHSEHYLPSVPAKKRLSAKSESSNVEIITDVQVNNVRVTFRESTCLPSQQQSTRPLASVTNSNSNGSEKRTKVLEEAEKHAFLPSCTVAKMSPPPLTKTTPTSMISPSSQTVGSLSHKSEDRVAPVNVPTICVTLKHDSTSSPTSAIVTKPAESERPTAETASKTTSTDKLKCSPSGNEKSVKPATPGIDKSPSADANGRPLAPKTSAERNGKVTAGGKLEKIVEVCKAKATPAAGFSSQSTYGI